MATVLYLLSVYFAAWAAPEEVLRELRTLQPWLYGLGVLTAFLLALNIVRAPRLMQMESDADRKRLRLNNAGLADKLNPKLEVLYKNGDDDHVVARYGKVSYRVIRVRVTNNSGGSSVEKIQVKAERFANFGDTPIFNVPLRVSHDRDNSKRNGFTLSPGSKELIDVVQKSSENNDLYLCHALGGNELVVTHAKELLVKVEVTASNVPPQEIELWIRVNDDGDLSCQAIS